MEERDLGYVFQNIILFPHMNVKDNAGYSPRVKGLSEEQIEERSRNAMELVGVLEQQGYLPNELSGGAQQKASLARAIASKARFGCCGTSPFALRTEGESSAHSLWGV